MATQAADALRLSLLDSCRESYLLGAAAPDMNALSRQSREETHFLRHGAEPDESGARNMLEAEPHLGDAKNLAAGTAAFVAGYLTHLVCDEIWYFDICRPFFRGTKGEGYDSTLGERVLACELERQDRLDRGKVAGFAHQLACADVSVANGLVEPDALGQWRDRVRSAMGIEPTWMGFRPFLERYLPPQERDLPEAYERFLKTLPRLLEGIIEQVSSQRIEQFRRNCVEKSMEAVGGYLG